MKKLKLNEIVVFPKKFKMNGLRYNCILQQKDGTLLFFDKEYYKDAKKLEHNLKTKSLLLPH